MKVSARDNDWEEELGDGGSQDGGISGCGEGPGQVPPGKVGAPGVR